MNVAGRYTRLNMWKKKKRFNKIYNKKFENRQSFKDALRKYCLKNNTGGDFCVKIGRIGLVRQL